MAATKALSHHQDDIVKSGDGSTTLTRSTTRLYDQRRSKTEGSRTFNVKY